MSDETTTDFAVVVYREDDRWAADALPPTVGEDLDELVEATRRQSGGGGAIGLVSVEDDFFVAVRVLGREVKLLLSDVTAAGESPLAGEVLEALDLPMPGPEDDRAQPAGDLGIFSDLGLQPMELGALCDDMDLYPDQMLDSIAARLGFAEPFRRAMDSALAD
ncbi:MAG TPA: tRNA adenosine deaminase-associated protein [Sporichthyaceae bacterium]|jgi:putative tRNA adenosine deaminase-associated protein|nr:tRNA adenosine deaminase-associated protein [Sporichthyaceae bacterium]